MRPATRFVFVSILLVNFVLASGSASSQTKPSTHSTVAGRVTIKDKPAPGVVVCLRPSEPSGTNQYEVLPRATTNPDGTYRISEVVPGSYEVLPAAPSYVASDASNPIRRTVIVGVAEKIEDINFALVRGGVITGKITDADGRPVVQQQVMVYRTEVFERRAQQPQMPIVPTTAASTDDRGIYRMFGLTPGRYKVAAGRPEEGSGPSVMSTRTSFKQVFYDAAADQSTASIIEVGEGSEATNVDITLGRPLQTFSARGRIVEAEKGSAVPNTRFALQRARSDRPEFVSMSIVSNANGEFFVDGLIPGKYSPFVMPEPGAELRAEPMTFEVLDQDITGLTVTMVRGATIVGSVVVESEDKTILAKINQLPIRASIQPARGSNQFGQFASATISPDGSFRLAGLGAGLAMFEVGDYFNDPGSKGFQVSRIERDGVVQTRGVEIKDREEVTGVRIVVTYGTASIRGVVNATNGPLPGNARIGVRITRTGEQTSNMPYVRVDGRGHFLIENLPAGDYDIHVTVGTPGTRPRPPIKQQVTIANSGVTDIVLTVDMGATPNP